MFRRWQGGAAAPPGAQQRGTLREPLPEREGKLGNVLPMKLTPVGTSRCPAGAGSPPEKRAEGFARDARIARHVAPLLRGADGAARRPYQVQGFNARILSGNSTYEMATVLLKSRRLSLHVVPAILTEDDSGKLVSAF